MRWLALLLAAPLLLAAEKVEILRDDFGVPHVYAQTPAGAAYGAGYAQSEDRLDEMMKNYRKALGTMSEAFGPEWFTHDYRQRLWRHAEVAQANYAKLPADVRSICEGFVHGVEAYERDHPEKVPAWAMNVEPWHLVALGRYIIWGWPEGEIAGELGRAGVRVELPAYHGSNQMLIAPTRSANHAPIAVIDPHLSWYGEFRFYEIRMYAKNWGISGAAILGLPYPSLGHTRYASVAMTTGGPDTSDVFEEEVAGGKYKFKDEWKPLVMRKDTIRVKTGDSVVSREVTFEATQHGPIVAHKDGKAFAAAIPYADAYGLMETSWKMANAHNLTEMKRALSSLEYMQQNIMVATTGGDIFYVRHGRVPIRPAGCDPSKPMNGASGACEWKGIHPFEDLMQVTNPPQGYMQNNNTSPQWMMKDSPFQPEKWKDKFYLYNFPAGPPAQRPAMTLEELSSDSSVTEQAALRYAFSPAVFHAEQWIAKVKECGAQGEAAKAIGDWNRREEAGSRGALAFYFFKLGLGEAKYSRAWDAPADVTTERVVKALAEADAKLAAMPTGATWGTLFRVGRAGSDRTFPANGGTLMEAGMATPRATSFSKKGDIMLGHTGQTSTQIVFLTKKPKSYMVIPLGESDDPKSPHYDDQAEKLFSKSLAKPTFFMDRRGLERVVTEKKVLVFDAARK